MMHWRKSQALRNDIMEGLNQQSKEKSPSLEYPTTIPLIQADVKGSIEALNDNQNLINNNNNNISYVSACSPLQYSPSITPSIPTPNSLTLEALVQERISFRLEAQLKAWVNAQIDMHKSLAEEEVRGIFVADKILTTHLSSSQNITNLLNGEYHDNSGASIAPNNTKYASKDSIDLLQVIIVLFCY
jgi:hypothetical protein